MVIAASARSLKCDVVSQGHSKSYKDVLATVVVAYVTLVAPAEIVLFVERQLTDEGTFAAGRHLALAIDVTNVMQTVRCGYTRHRLVSSSLS